MMHRTGEVSGGMGKQANSFSRFLQQLSRRDDDAIARLGDIVEPPLRLLGQRLVERRAIAAHELTRFVERAIVWSRLYLVSWPASQRRRVTDSQPVEITVQRLITVAAARHFGDPSQPAEPAGVEAAAARSGESRLQSGYRFRWENRPAVEVSGDLLASGEEPQRAWLFVGDACGKSWLAHLVAEGTRCLVAEAARSARGRPERLLQRITEQLVNVLPDGMFVTAIAAFIGSDGSAHFASAGGPPLFLCLGSTRCITLEQLNGTPLGLVFDELPGPAHGTCQWHLATADEIVMMSDGVTDQDTADGKLERRLRGLTDQTLASGEMLFDRVWNLLGDALQSSPQFDDVTLAAVQRLEEPPPMPKITCEQCPDDACPDLYDRTTRGDQAATGLLDAILRSRTEGLLKRILRGEQHAVDDALQDAWLALLSYPWDRRCPLCLYFRLLACRKAIDFQKRHDKTFGPWPDGFDVADTAAFASFDPSQPGANQRIAELLSELDVATRDCIQHKIEKLSARQRETVLALIDGLSRREIAAQFGLGTPQAVSYYVRQVEDAIRECLREK
jgi:DNA-directed RNA polymerase specialized sigma24 family protein